MDITQLITPEQRSFIRNNPTAMLAAILKEFVPVFATASNTDFPNAHHHPELDQEWIVLAQHSNAVELVWLSRQIELRPIAHVLAVSNAGRITLSITGRTLNDTVIVHAWTPGACALTRIGKLPFWCPPTLPISWIAKQLEFGPYQIDPMIADRCI